MGGSEHRPPPGAARQSIVTSTQANVQRIVARRSAPVGRPCLVVLPRTAADGNVHPRAPNRCRHRSTTPETRCRQRFPTVALLSGRAARRSRRSHREYLDRPADSRRRRPVAADAGVGRPARRGARGIGPRARHPAGAQRRTKRGTARLDTYLDTARPPSDGRFFVVPHDNSTVDAWQTPATGPGTDARSVMGRPLRFHRRGTGSSPVRATVPVSFNGRTGDCYSPDRGSNPRTGAQARVAQQEERLRYNALTECLDLLGSLAT
jgi:hypothetical protein